MNQEQKKLTREIYEHLCKVACQNPKHPSGDESVQDSYWWSVCREVYHYLGVELVFRYSPIPVIWETPGDMYRSNLQRLVLDAQSEPFDTMQIPSRYITEATKTT